MVFTAPSWVPQLPFDPPDSIPIPEFLFNERYGRLPLAASRSPYTCGITGQSWSATQVRDRIEPLARGLAQELGWHPNHGSEWDKVIGVFSVNTIDTLPLAWATHRLSGISSPANAAYSAPELEHQLRDSGAKALFTCLPLLATALEAAKKAGIPKERVFLLDLPQEVTEGKGPPEQFKTKGVMISHRNVIANVLQIKAYDSEDRLKGETEVGLGLLPQSHIYSLVVICHASTYRGDEVINLPKFDFGLLLKSIQRFKINTLYLVPPIIIALVNNNGVVDKFDVSSVTGIFTGAAPLGAETAETIQKQRPTWKIRQGYGLTETSTVVCSTSIRDIWLGSSGSLITNVEARLVSPEGAEITGYDKPGELLVRSPSVVLGYLNNDKANRETFQDGWLRTGDEAVIRKSPKGHEHVFIVDRIKELIKVKGMQVAPAELEAHLLAHPSVADAAVIPVPDDTAGEVPKAFVVKHPSIGLEEGERMLRLKISRHVAEHKARHKWLKGGVEFVDAIPKSPSGKILRRLLRDREREARRAAGAKL
ncbi:MAG: hypothetical protein M1832_005908 [Thelocarpon impressellum]|nr:MAG: hypothetical protein M1832_005908 [Thelocarpon impressellum]